MNILIFHILFIFKSKLIKEESEDIKDSLKHYFTKINDILLNKGTNEVELVEISIKSLDVILVYFLYHNYYFIELDYLSNWAEMHFSTLITHLNDIYYNLVHTTNENSAKSATKWFLNRFSKLIDLYDQIVSNRDYSDRIKIEVEVFFHSLRKLLIELEASFEERCLDSDIIDKVINLNCLDEKSVKNLKLRIKKYKAGKIDSKCEGSQLSIDFKIRSVDLEMIYKKFTKKILNIYSHYDKRRKGKEPGF